MFTQSQLDALEASIAQGALTVEYNGKKVTYRSQKEMLELREVIRRELKQIEETGTRLHFEHSKGL